MYDFDPYNAFLAIATNIPVLLMTGFGVQGHILEWFLNDHISLKTGLMAAENSALPSYEFITF